MKDDKKLNKKHKNTNDSTFIQKSMDWFLYDRGLRHERVN